MLRQAELLSEEISRRATDLTTLRAQGVQLSLLHPEDDGGLFEKIVTQQNSMLQRFAHELLFDRLIDRRMVLFALQLFYDGSPVFHKHRDWVRDEFTMLACSCREQARQTGDTSLHPLFIHSQNS
ncbi:MAG TPA: hypothetical protein VL728_06710 [Cyclobacteriaceae bacterium]|jgi:hypothetical protein|nr:hypothetical protein [Cyclobacteriaceae bacterium]